MTFLVDLEKSNKSGRRLETAKNTGTTNIPSKSNSKFQSEAKCNAKETFTRCSVRFFSFPNKVDEIDNRGFRFIWLI